MFTVGRMRRMHRGQLRTHESGHGRRQKILEGSVNRFVSAHNVFQDRRRTGSRRKRRTRSGLSRDGRLDDRVLTDHVRIEHPLEVDVHTGLLILLSAVSLFALNGPAAEVLTDSHHDGPDPELLARAGAPRRMMSGLGITARYAPPVGNTIPADPRAGAYHPSENNARA